MVSNIQEFKTNNKYYCELCDYKCSKIFLWKQHNLTAKHIWKRLETNRNSDINNKLQCLSCNKNFQNRSGLWKHKKKCEYKDTINQIIMTDSSSDIKSMFMQVIEENKELRKLIVDLVPKIGNTTNNTINNKNKFNINVFLNEKCKDAISMDQFIDKIDITMKNLLTTKDKGLGTGLSNIIIDNMAKLSLYERPMHCTDKKRETLYVKNEEWEKDGGKQHINDLLKKVEKKQMKSIDKWTIEHPNYMDSEQLQEEYLNLIRSCTSSMDDCKEKVIKNVCDNVYIPE